MAMRFDFFKTRNRSMHLLRHLTNMILNPSTKLTALLFVLLSTIGSRAAERSDEFFLPNPFGDQFPDVHMASEMMVLSKAVHSTNTSALLESDQYNIIRVNDTGSTDLMVVTTDASGTSLARIIVVFRGTDNTTDGDWSTDFDVAYGPYGPPEGPIVSETIYDDLGGGNGLEGFEIRVHSGFNDALFSQNLYADLKAFLFDYLDDPMYNRTVYVTGHSLGAADAQLFGTLLAYDNPDVHVIVTTFGSPMVGNYGYKVLADSLKNMNNWRFVNGQDVFARNPIVPTGYYPAGHIMWKQPGENGLVVAYYRQTGDAEQGYVPIGNGFYTVGFHGRRDHKMMYYVEWLDYAMRNMQANYICGFQGSNLTTCMGGLNEPSPSSCTNQKDCPTATTKGTSTSPYLFSFWCYVAMLLHLLV